MRQIIVCPELNYWMIKTLKNSPVTDTFHRIPSIISDVWRDSRSVLELMFNECFQPQPTPSSSSSYFPDMNVEADNDRPYIYLYRKCSPNLLPDKNIVNRLQVYRFTAQTYAVNAQKFADIFDYSGTTFVPQLNGMIQETSEVVEPSPPKDWLWMDRTTQKTVLPKDVLEKDRSPYITYKNEIYGGSNHTYVETDNTPVTEPYPPIPIYPPDTNIFNFTQSDLMMLDLLYLYKTTGTASLIGIDFDSLSCIGKLVFIYLDAFVNDVYTHYSTEDTISDGSDILCTLYEKFVLDIIYSLKMEQYGIIYKDSEVINDEIKKVNIDQFMILKKMNQRVLITEEIFDAGEIVLTEKLPWDRKDFYIYKDGDLLVNDVDYTVVIDFTDPNNPVARVHLISNDILPDQLLEMIWSYILPYSAYSQADQ